MKIFKLTAVTLTALLTFGCGSSGGSNDDPVIDDPTPTTPDPVETNQYASITDTDETDTGELRYKFSEGMTTGKVVASFLYQDGETETAYLSLFDSKNSTNSLIGELKFDEGNVTLRGDDTLVASFTPGEWFDVEMTWNTSSTTDAGTYTVTINGQDYGSFTSQNVTPGVAVTATTVKFSSNTGTATTALAVDDFAVYADEEATSLIFEDDYERYELAADLTADTTEYNSSSFSVVVAGTNDDETTQPPVEEGSTQVAAITDNDSTANDSGEIRYKFDAGMTTGKVTVSYLYDANETESAYLSLFDTKNSTSSLIGDLKFDEGKISLRGEDALGTIANFTPGAWMDIEVTWNTTSATEVGTYTVTIDGAVIGTYDSQNSDLNLNEDGLVEVTAISMKLSSNSGVSDYTLYVDDLAIYADEAGETLEFADDYEDSAIGTDLVASPYSTNGYSAVVAAQPTL